MEISFHHANNMAFSVLNKFLLKHFQQFRCIGFDESCNFVDTSIVENDKPQMQWQMVWSLNYIDRCYANV